MMDKIRLINRIGAVLGRPIGLPKAVRLARHFKREELERIYCKVVFG